MPPLADVVDFPRTMVAACGTYPNAVAAVQAFSRTIWAVFIEHSLERRHRRLPYWSVDAETLTSTLTSSLRPFVDDPQSFVRAILNRLTDAQLARQESDRTIGLLPSAMQPTRVARECLGSLRPDHDLRFFIARAIRRHYRCVLSSRMADQFQQLSRAANLLAGGDLIATAKISIISTTSCSHFVRLCSLSSCPKKIPDRRFPCSSNAAERSTTFNRRLPYVKSI